MENNLFICQLDIAMFRIVILFCFSMPVKKNANRWYAKDLVCKIALDSYRWYSKKISNDQELI